MARSCSCFGTGWQQVLVKHGGIYIRVHPCRLKLEEYPSHEKTKTNYSEYSGKHIDCSSKASNIDSNIASDSEDSDSEKEEYEGSDINRRNETIVTEPNEQHIPLGDGRDKDQDDTVNTANKKKSNVLKKGMDIKYKINDDEDD